MKAAMLCSAYQRQRKVWGGRNVEAGTKKGGLRGWGGVVRTKCEEEVRSSDSIGVKKNIKGLHKEKYSYPQLCQASKLNKVKDIECESKLA